MNKTIDKLVTFIRRITQPDKIILFGSVANGNHNARSDIDLLIIVDNVSDRMKIKQLVEDYLLGFSLSSDVLVRTRDEVETETKVSLAFITSILKNGKIIYEKTH